MGRWREITVVFVAVASASLLFGFLLFASLTTSVAVRSNAQADAIVALTGGAQRIRAAGGLLEAGHARRLLISGVNRKVSHQELRHLLGIDRKLFECCVDVDVAAQNTRGNAIETRKWMKKHGFESLIVVTSSYHMPRSLTELGYLLPAVDLVSYPVVSDRLRDPPWWLDRESALLLGIEYLKYLPSAAQFGLGRAIKISSKADQHSDAVQKAVAIQ